jgi:hypothetical protein
MEDDHIISRLDAATRTIEALAPVQPHNVDERLAYETALLYVRLTLETAVDFPPPPSRDREPQAV